jgi:hypothetical protein
VATRAAVRFRQREVTGTVKAAEAAGLTVTGVECGPDGKIVVLTTRDRQDKAQPNLEIAL